MGGWVTLLGVDEVWELGWVSQEEDWGVVGNHVPVALIGSELDGETTWVTSAIVRTRLTTDSRESDSDGTLLASLEDVGKADVVKRLGGLVETVSSTTLGVNNTLWNAFTVEVGEKVHQVEVLEKQRSVLTDSLSLVWMWHWDTIAGGVEGVLGSGVAVVVVISKEITVLLAVGGVVGS